MNLYKTLRDSLMFGGKLYLNYAFRKIENTLEDKYKIREGAAINEDYDFGSRIRLWLSDVF